MAARGDHKFLMLTLMIVMIGLKLLPFLIFPRPRLSLFFLMMQFVLKLMLVDLVYSPVVMMLVLVVMRLLML